MANSNNTYVDVDSGSIASARQDILSSYVPQPPPPPQAEPEHPVVSYARSLMFPDQGATSIPEQQQQDAPPSSAQLGMGAQQARASLPMDARGLTAYEQQDVAHRFDNTSYLGDQGQLSQIVQPFGISPFVNTLTDPRAYLAPQTDYEKQRAMENAQGMFAWTRAGSGGLADVHVPGQVAAGAKSAAEAAAEAAPQAAGTFADQLGVRAPQALEAAKNVKKATPEEIAQASADFNKAAGTPEAAAKPKFGDAGTSFQGIDPSQLTRAIQQTTPYNSITEFGKAVRSGEAADSGAPQGLIDQFLKGEVEMGLRARGVNPDVAGPLTQRIASREAAAVPGAAANEALATADTGAASKPTLPLGRQGIWQQGLSEGMGQGLKGQAAQKYADDYLLNKTGSSGLLGKSTPDIGAAQNPGFDTVPGEAPKLNLPPEVASSPIVQEAMAHPDGQAILESAAAKVEELGGKPWAEMSPTDRLGQLNDMGTGTRSFGKSDAAQLFNEVVYNGLVFPKTNILHSLASGVMSLRQYPENVLYAAADKLGSKLGLTSGKSFSLDAANAAGVAQIKATADAFAHDVLPQIRYGDDYARGLKTDYDIPREVSTAILNGEYGSNPLLRVLGVAGKTAALGDVPVRTISAVDNALRRGLTASDLMLQGARAGSAKGLSGDALHSFMADFVHDAPLDALRSAEDAAKTQLNRGTPGALATGVLDLKNKTGFVGTTLLPFFNTRLNVLKDATTWSPLGFGRILPANTPVFGYFTHRTLTEADRIKAVTRATVGTLALMPIWQHVTEDNITGDAPSDPKAKMQWLGDPSQPSHQERAIRTPWGWVSYAKAPGGDLIAAIADAAQGVRDGKSSDVSGAQVAVHSLIQFMAHEEQGLTDAFGTVTHLAEFLSNMNDPRLAAVAAQDLANRGFQITPASGLLRADAALNDPNYKGVPKGTKGFGDTLGQNYRRQFPTNFPLGDTAELPNGAPRVPGVTSGVGSLFPVHVTPAGQTIQGTAAGMPPTATSESGRLASAVKGFKPISLPNDKIGQGQSYEVKVNGQQYMDLSRYVGEARDAAIKDLLLKPMYQNAPDAVKAITFKNAVIQADKKGQQDYLRNGVLTSTDPQQIKAEAVALMRQGTNTDKTKSAYTMAQSGKLTPQVKAAIDAARPQVLPGQRQEPSVDDYIKAAPLVTKYLSIPPYLQGNAQEWAALKDARTRLTQMETMVKQTQNLPASTVTQMALSKLAPQDQQLIQKYPPAASNPARRYFINQNQWVVRFLGQ